MYSRQGFTLVELLIVMALVSVMITAVLLAQEAPIVDATRAKSNIAVILNALDDYYNIHCSALSPNEVDAAQLIGMSLISPEALVNPFGNDFSPRINWALVPVTLEVRAEIAPLNRVYVSNLLAPNQINDELFSWIKLPDAMANPLHYEQYRYRSMYQPQCG